MRKRILLLSDDEPLIAFFQKKFPSPQFKLMVARTKEKGIELIKEEYPQLVVLDFSIDKDWKFLEELNQEGYLIGKSLIVIFNSYQVDLIERAQKLGAKDWITKTEFDPQKVVLKVLNQLNFSNQ